MTKISEEARRAKLLAQREQKLKELKNRQKLAANKPKKSPDDEAKDGSRRHVPLNTTTRHGEMVRAQRMVASDVHARATQHIISETPINKSLYNGFNGQQVSPAQLRAARPTKNAVRIIPIGGVGEMGIGKNMTALEYGDEIILVDMGIMFVNEDYPGVDYMVPNIEYIEKNLRKVKAIAFTHGHLDHIGAVQHLLPRFPHITPIYGTEFTLNMVKKSMNELPEVPEMNYINVEPWKHDIIQVSPSLSLEFVHVLHSIPGSTAIVVRTPNGVVLFSGDWRFEDNPIDKPFDMTRLTEIATKEGIHVMLNESTNIDTPGRHTWSEIEVGDSFGKVMNEYKNSRIIISSFSSQILRIQRALEEAAKHGRKVAFAGYSMINNLEVALRSRQIKVPKDVIMKMEDIIKLPDSRVAIICTGSQGELNAVLNRMITGQHKYIKVKNTDVVVFSSNPIPGNEIHVVNTESGLMREGAEVIRHGKNHVHGMGPLHLSGHAYFEDHVEYVQTLKPLNYIPNHGEFYMLHHSAEMAENVCGIPRERILVCDDGDVVEFLPDKTIKKNGRINVGSELYDGTGNEVHDAVVKDRLHISNEGIFIIVLTLNKKTGRLVKTPDVISRAFVYLNDSEELIGKIRHYLRTKTDHSSLDASMDTLKQEIKDDVAHILYDSTGHTPIVIPVVNKV
ncbi:MAG: ribonuclease J [Candidatus Nomurabacteria bacterium]|jgi:ribonuclease J|nr:ribonuclease J [Candidatus Nomurabacteria bacterium]